MYVRAAGSITTGPSASPTPGVHRLILLHGAKDERGILDMVDATGRNLIGKV